MNFCTSIKVKNNFTALNAATCVKKHHTKTFFWQHYMQQKTRKNTCYSFQNWGLSAITYIPKPFHFSHKGASLHYTHINCLDLQT